MKRRASAAVPGLLLAGLLASLASAPSAPLARAATVAMTDQATPQHQTGDRCVTVKSRNGSRATICAIVNESDVTADTWAQALITFRIRSGHISRVHVKGGLYLRTCDFGFCSNQNYLQSPVKVPGPVSATFISDGFGRDGGASVQARVNTPCVTWQNGQNACYNGVLESNRVTVP
jgi:hypothetical protein